MSAPTPPEPAQVADLVRAEYDRHRATHLAATERLRDIDRERAVVLSQYHTSFNAMIEASVRLQRLRHSDGPGGEGE